MKHAIIYIRMILGFDIFMLQHFLNSSDFTFTKDNYDLENNNFMCVQFAWLCTNFHNVPKNNTNKDL